MPQPTFAQPARAWSRLDRGPSSSLVRSPSLRLVPRHRRQASPEMSTDASSSPSHAPPVSLSEPFAFCPSAAGAATPWLGARQAPWPPKELCHLAESTLPPIPCVKVAIPAGPAGRQVQRHGRLLCPTPPLSRLRRAPPLPRASVATSTRPVGRQRARCLLLAYARPRHRSPTGAPVGATIIGDGLPPAGSDALETRTPAGPPSSAPSPPVIPRLASASAKEDEQRCCLLEPPTCAPHALTTSTPRAGASSTTAPAQRAPLATSPQF